MTMDCGCVRLFEVLIEILISTDQIIDIQLMLILFLSSPPDSPTN